jgi:hypothetical protein
LSLKDKRIGVEKTSKVARADGLHDLISLARYVDVFVADDVLGADGTADYAARATNVSARAIASSRFVQATKNLTPGNPEATARIVEGLITGMGFSGVGQYWS